MNSKSPSKGQSSGVKALFEDSPECSISNVEAKTTFHYFADLPSELQIQVWEAAASIPRVVFLRPKTAVDRTNLPEKFCDKIPAVLHVNRQSRHVCQHTYHVRIQVRGRGSFWETYLLAEHDIVALNDADIKYAADQQR